MRTVAMIGVCAVVAVMAVGSGEAANMNVQVGDVKDSRTTGKFFARLEVELKLLGDDLDGAKGFRCTVTKAVDDTGRNLVKEEKEQPGFSDMDDDSSNQAQVTVQLKNPSRKAAMVKEISGDVEIFKPAADPASVVTITNLAVKARTPVSHPTLKAAGIQVVILPKEKPKEEVEEEKDQKAGDAITEGGETKDKTEAYQMGEEMGKAFAGMFGGMMGSGENSFAMQVNDPQSQLIKVEFLDASGNAIDTNGSMRMNDMRSYDFSEPLPQGARLRVYVATTKSLIKVPFALKDIILP